MPVPSAVRSKESYSNMLPTGFHDVTALMEVTTVTWRSVLNAAGESARLNGETLTHDRLWESFTSDAPGKELLDALEVIHELGTDAGRDLLEQAAADQRVQLGATHDEPVRELAARMWTQSRRNTALAEVLVRARVNSLEAAHARSYREFVGNSASASGAFDGKRLRAAVSKWCTENQKSEAIEVYYYERHGECRYEVLRGDPVKRVVEIRDGRPSILDFRPAASDHIRYDPETRRLGIATRSPRLLQMYREVVGSLLTNDAEFFSGENICTLRPLQKCGRDLFERHRPPGVLRVDVVELRWRRGDRDKLSVRGRDCFQILSDIGARMNEGELIEAKLSIAFAGGGRRTHVSIKVPNRIDIKGSANENLVEQFLDDVGIRGAFGTEDEQRDFWSLHPYRLPEEIWRRHVGTNFDRLLGNKILRPVHLETTTHPDHPAFPGALTVEAIDAETIVGIGEDPVVGLRTLTASDFAGYELDVACLTREIAVALELEGRSTEIASGIWSLGRRTLSSAVTIGVFLAIRKPSNDAAILIRDACKGLRPVLLIPLGCSCALDLPQIQCRIPSGRYDALVANIVEQLGLQHDVSPLVWVQADLILDKKRGRAWFRRVELSKLQPNSHPFTFAVAVALAEGHVVKKGDLNQQLSPKRHDEDAAKTAKRDFIQLVKASFENAGIEYPPEAKDIFMSRDGGYVLNTTAKVLA